MDDKTVDNTRNNPQVSIDNRQNSKLSRLVHLVLFWYVHEVQTGHAHACSGNKINIIIETKLMTRIINV